MGSIAAMPFQNKANKQTDRGFANAMDEMDNAKDESLGYLSPYAGAGQLALSPLTGIITGQQYDPATGQSTTLTPDQRNSLLYQSPGYQFSMQQGLQALTQSQAARGLSLSESLGFVCP